jgi:carboxymethylenebutenolidase
VAIVIDHPVEELLDVGPSEPSALDLHATNNLVENQRMCYSDDARVPLPPISGAAADQGDLVLTSSDGTKFAAYFARAEKPTGAGIVVMPDVRGLHQFYKELGQRFAEAGIDAVAIDYFGRTAGIGDRGEGFDFMPHVDKTTQEDIAKDVAAAIEYLKSKDGGAVKSAFTVGFCFGGSSSWNQSAFQPGLNGAIGFYGRPPRSEPYISKMKAPLLLLLAGADAATPQEAFHEFDKKLTDAKVPHEMHIYEGAPHSFFDRTFDQWKDACDDAWRRMLGFIEKHG